MAKVIWLTGISGAGKSTLGELLAQEIAAQGKPVEYLDGNLVRDFFDNDLGFTDDDRIMAIKRSVFGSFLLAKNGVNVVVASIAGTYEVRDFIRKKLGKYYLQVYVEASTDAVIERDVRGLYQAYKEGKEKNLPGLDQEYQIPRNPDIVVSTDSQSVEQSLSQLKSFIIQKL